MLRDLRFALAPRWLAWHATLVAVLVAFIWLGSWQLDSYAEAGRRQHAAAEQETAPISDVLAPGDRLPASAVGRTVTAVGRYDEANRLLVPGRRHGGSGGDRDGYWVVAALQTADGVLPVNRGWVATVDDPAVEEPATEVTVTGVVQPSETQGDSQVDPLADLPDGQIAYLATVQLLDVLPYSPDELYDGYVAMRSERPAPALAPQPVEVRGVDDDGVGKWRNLGYGLQWWFFAGAAVFFWWSVIRRSLRERRAADEAAQVPAA